MTCRICSNHKVFSTPVHVNTRLTRKAPKLYRLFLYYQPTEALHAPITLDGPMGMERVQTSRGNTVQKHKSHCVTERKVRTSRGECENKNEPLSLELLIEECKTFSSKLQA